MIGLSLDKAKEIVVEPPPPDFEALVAFRSQGRAEALLKFTRLIIEAEVPTLDEIAAISSESRDLIHLSGVHKFRFGPGKCEELRSFWGQLWTVDAITNQIPGLKDYIAAVCEVSRYRAGKTTRPYGLFDLPGETHRHFGQKPWRTAEWYEARKPPRHPRQRKPKLPKVVIEPLVEFYPYIPAAPTEEHEFLMAVDALVPKGYRNDTRADLCQDMIVAILSGDVTLENLKDDLPRHLKALFNKCAGKYGHLSLDAPVVSGKPHTLGETIGL